MFKCGDGRREIKVAKEKTIGNRGGKRRKRLLNNAVVVLTLTFK